MQNDLLKELSTEVPNLSGSTEPLESQLFFHGACRPKEIANSSVY